MTARTSRQRAKPAPSNVVPLRARTETTEDIVRAVQGKSARVGQDITRQLQELVAFANAQHRTRAEALFPIGVEMNRDTLDDWIEIGQRMLAQQGRR